MLASIDVLGNASLTPPVGWTLLRPDATSGSELTKRTYWHVVGAVDPATYVWTLAAEQPASGVVVAYSGVDTASPVEDHDAATGTSGSLAAPSVDSSATGSMLVSLVGLAANGSVTQPSGMSERAETSGGTGQSRVVSEASDAVLATGASGTRTASASRGGPWVHQLVVLRPAA